jgi:hypothetical protein
MEPLKEEPTIWSLVVADMWKRDKLGRDRYGVPLRAHDGRDTLQDAYEEALDLCVYLRKDIEERKGKLHRGGKEPKG